MSHLNRNNQHSTLLSRSYYPWLLLGMSCLFLFFKYVVYVSPSVMTNDLMQQFHVHATGLGALAACYFYTYLIMQLLAGPLLDHYSVRKLGSLALVCMSVGLALFAYAPSLGLAYVARMLMGAGAAFATVSYLKVTALWFSERLYDFVAGLLATAASLGAMASQVPLAYGVAHFGWQATLKVSACLGMLIALFYCLSVRSKPSEEANSHQCLSGLITLLTSKKVWLLMLYSGFAWAPLAVFGGLWGNPFLQTMYHLDKIQASACITMAFLGLALGGPLGGYLSSLWQTRLSIMFVSLGVSFLALVGLLYFPVQHTTVVMAELFLFGMGTGPFMLGFSFGKTWFAVSMMATFVSIVNTGDGLFTAVAEPLVGKLLDLHWQGQMVHGVPSYDVHAYLIAMSALPICLVLGALCLGVVAYYEK